MAKRIIWTEAAHADRKEILLYWKKNNVSITYSRKLNELFKRAVLLISAHPEIGRKTDIENIRIKLVRDYLLFYEETEKEIIILSIWDNRRDPEQVPY